MPYFRRDADTPPTPAATKRMRAVRKAATKAELLLRRELHRRGLRYRVNVRGLPGTPDLLFRRHRVAVLVHGCFWHQHNGCRAATKPRVNSTYWGPKLRRNTERDAENEAALAKLGFKTVVVWECEVERDRQAAAERVIKALVSVRGKR
jgi:DNA mismatch endonuclease, patch repair protein